ncbi:MAG: helix-turn-helix transcriptional regulator [Ruminococcaceae bacterium]|nr:helix-turn-helix transcriptional regulator [Oscillospiraceae bacterium]
MAIFGQNRQNIEFVYYSCWHERCAPGINRHILPYHEITYCLAGHLEYYVNDELTKLGAGDVIVLHPGDERRRDPILDPTDYASFNVIFPPETEIPLHGKYSGCIENDTPWLLDKFGEEFLSDTSYRTECCIGLFEFIYARLLDRSLVREHPAVRAARLYIVSHISQPLTLETIAGAVFLEPHYLCALFKKETGMTVFTYITKQRISQAERMIHTGGRTLAEIAESCGFNDYSYFSSTFRKITGQPPTGYRDSLK